MTVRTLTDADLAALRELVREEIARNGPLVSRPSNGRPLTVSETTSEAARRELERRGLRAPRQQR